MKNSKKTGTIVLYVALALFLIFAILYFAGVFDKKAPVEDEPPVIEETQEPEDTEEEKEPQAYVSDAITFDENGVADVGDLHDDPNKGKLDDLKPVDEPVSDPPVTEPVEQTTTQQPAEQTEQKPQPQQSSGGTAMYNGRPVRSVSSVSELGTAKKPFETVMVNGVPYRWTGSEWGKLSTERTPNQSTIIDTSDPSWTEQVGH